MAHKIAPPEAALGTPCTIHMVINGPESKDSGYKGQYENISPNGRLFALCKEPPIYANSTGKSTLMGKPSNPNVPSVGSWVGSIGVTLWDAQNGRTLTPWSP